MKYKRPQIVLLTTNYTNYTNEVHATTNRVVNYKLHELHE